MNPPKLKIGDKVVVHVYKYENSDFTAIVRSAVLVDGWWHYNHDTEQSFYFRDVKWVQKGRKWKWAH
jgi:hypothetical protein